MKHLIHLLLLFCALFCACNYTQELQPDPNIYARQMGIQSVDTTSYWQYQNIQYFSAGDSSKYKELHTVIDTATILGQFAYKINVSTPFGSYTYKLQTDSTSVTIDQFDIISRYTYPSDTFIVNTCILAKASDTTVTFGGVTYPNVIAFHVWNQSCYNAEAYYFYEFGTGLVASYAYDTLGNVNIRYLLSSN